MSGKKKIMCTKLQNMDSNQRLATVKAKLFILKRAIRVMQSDLKYGNYSDDVKMHISEELEKNKARYYGLNKEIES